MYDNEAVNIVCRLLNGVFNFSMVYISVCIDCITRIE